MSERVDGTLQSATQVAALALNHEIEEHGGRELGEESVRLVLNTMHQTSFPRPAILVRDGQRLVAEKPGSAGMPAEVLTTRLPAGHKGLITVTSNSGELFRIAVANVSVPFIGARYEVIANESLSSMEAELSSLRESLLILVPVCLLSLRRVDICSPGRVSLQYWQWLKLRIRSVRTIWIKGSQSPMRMTNWVCSQRRLIGFSVDCNRHSVSSGSSWPMRLMSFARPFPSH